jgi:two-component system, LuxR family, sensor kinase FixL
LRQAQAELAHLSRVTTMRELTASLRHEIKQPIAAAVTEDVSGPAVIPDLAQRFSFTLPR